MYKQRQLLLLLAILLTSTANVLAQRINVSRSTSLEVDETISRAEITKIVDATEEIINQYAQRGHLTDEDGKVSKLAANRFRNLFRATATIFPDYLEYPSGQTDNASSYMNIVRDKFPESGLPFRLTNAEVSSIVGETFRFYITKVRFNKSMAAYLDGKGRVRTSEKAGSRDYLLEMEIEISTEDLSQFRIRNIICAEKCGVEAADYESFLSVAGSYGFGLGSGETIDLPNQVKESSRFEFSQGLDVGLGFRYTTNRINGKAAAGKNLFATVGLDLRYREATTSVSNYGLNLSGSRQELSIPDGTLDANFQYRRLVDDVRVDEKISLTTIEVPLGLSYRLFHDSYERSLQLEFLAKPGIVLANTINFGGDGVGGKYDASIDGTNFTALGERSLYSGATDPTTNPFAACNCNELSRDESQGLETQPVALWVQFSPTYYGFLNRKDPVLGLQISLDFALNLISPVLSESTSEPLLTSPTGEQQAFANQYLDTNFTYVGIRVGLYLHKITPINIK